MVSHRQFLHKPDGTSVLICELFPIERLNERFYCKYCYTTHSDWHLMDRSEYIRGDEGRIVLCGKCEHTSLVDDEEAGG